MSETKTITITGPEQELSDAMRDRIFELWPTLPEAAKSRMLEKAIQSASEQDKPS
jgi:hypothetical protein